MIHYMKLNPKPFQQIQACTKTYDLRLYDQKRQALRAGDTIVFTNLADESQTLTTKVIALHVFDTFEELYHCLLLDKCGYDQENMAFASSRDMEQYYSKEEQAQYGVVGIEIVLIDE